MLAISTPLKSARDEGNCRFAGRSRRIAHCRQQWRQCRFTQTGDRIFCFQKMQIHPSGESATGWSPKSLCTPRPFSIGKSSMIKTPNHKETPCWLVPTQLGLACPLHRNQIASHRLSLPLVKLTTTRAGHDSTGRLSITSATADSFEYRFFRSIPSAFPTNRRALPRFPEYVPVIHG